MTNPTKKQFNDEQESDLRKANSVKSDGFNYSLTKEGNIAMKKQKICPHCKMEIDYLTFSVTATCNGQIYQNEDWEYDTDDLLRNTQLDDFVCPECGKMIAPTEEKAREFLK